MQTENDNGGPYALWELYKARVKAATGVEPTEPPSILEWMNADCAPDEDAQPST